LAQLRAAPLYSFNEREVDAYLQWLCAQQPDMRGRVVHLARKNIGQPYRAFLLGEFPFELRDADPLHCLSASDCVTFVEQTYAMAMACDWSSFFKTLQRLRYRGGIVGFETRNHFPEADWNPNNSWLFDEVTDRLADGAAEPMETRIDRAAFYSQHGLRRVLAPQIIQGRFVPVARLSAVTAGLADGDVVELVKGQDQWKHVSHMGLIFHDSAGNPTILHSGSPAVREESLANYLAKHADVVGLKLLRPKPQPLP
jgi:hypothetical protein